jgi:hypothetical protein
MPSRTVAVDVVARLVGAVVVSAREVAVAAAREVAVAPAREVDAPPLAASAPGLATAAAASTPPPTIKPAASAAIPAKRTRNLIAIRSFSCLPHHIRTGAATISDMAGSG